MKAARRKTSKNGRKPRDPSFSLLPLPSLITQPLGLQGWDQYEPVLLAALASADPLLLIGPHGSAKSFLLERLAIAMELEYRFYNASLINYDDLVGIPVPDDDRKNLRFISTPSAIWDAEVVFFDEINRTRHELQNKLFPIIHERRVQGISLDRLRYRWAAMNPPPSADGCDDALDVYLGAEPLDPALADRFSLIIEVPSWQQLSEDEKRLIFRGQFSGQNDPPTPLPSLVAAAKGHLVTLEDGPPRSLEDYLLTLLAHLESNGVSVSTRRATMLHRNILSVHAARRALYEQAYPELSVQLIDWNTSTLIAVQNSLPQTVQGRKPDRALVLGAHRHAWEVSRLDEENPWRQLLRIKDPVDRSIAACQMNGKIKDGELSQLVLDALGSQENRGSRTAIALAIYVATHKSRQLNATVFESLAQDLRPVLRPGKYDHDPDDCPRQRYRQVNDACEKVEEQTTAATSVRDRYAVNLLQGLLPDGYEEETPRKVLKVFFDTWERLMSQNVTINKGETGAS